jgi:hypothetical protein
MMVWVIRIPVGAKAAMPPMSAEPTKKAVPQELQESSATAARVAQLQLLPQIQRDLLERQESRL